jgi:hypothetical protein
VFTEVGMWLVVRVWAGFRSLSMRTIDIDYWTHVYLWCFSICTSVLHETEEDKNGVASGYVTVKTVPICSKEKSCEVNWDQWMHFLWSGLLQLLMPQ